VLWCCWLGGRKGIRPVKNWAVGCWHGYLSGARCRLADATATQHVIGWSQAPPGNNTTRFLLIWTCIIQNKTQFNKTIKRNTATRQLTVSCFSKIWIGFTFLVLAQPGSPGQRAVKRVCLCVRACVRVCVKLTLTNSSYAVFYALVALVWVCLCVCVLN